jgi:hypothetical protein
VGVDQACGDCCGRPGRRPSAGGERQLQRLNGRHDCTNGWSGAFAGAKAGTDGLSLPAVAIFGLGALPAERRKIITSHDAFRYFEQAYGVTFISPRGLSTSAEPTPQAVGRIIRQIRAEKIPAVFLENISDQRLMKRIADETGARIGGTLHSDALTPAGGPAGNFSQFGERFSVDLRCRAGIVAAVRPMHGQRQPGDNVSRPGAHRVPLPLPRHKDSAGRRRFLKVDAGPVEWTARQDDAVHWALRYPDRSVFHTIGRLAFPPAPP